MLLVCVRSYLKSVLGYKFLIFDSYNPDTVLVYYVSNDVRIRGCFLKPKGVREKKSLANSDVGSVPNNLSNLQRR